ncbi:MAG: bifunctional hydroxymethylpyrimidine kinase/phosphomethylpyrimidine kinase [Pseudomonadota bacterium]|nr:bifunctional hydroxymethylpyrimidine kinase/phosphomethylpyrimidine kinase [Pseudomonadota bacterium]|tara:strand:+ start:442 stop:1272 length:831 start_codon:yes stop_codon:yes gene_type:complete
MPKDNRTHPMNGRVLICAGSDSSGGAGIQADIKTVTALGCFAATAITALTSQNTKGVFNVLDIPTSFLRQQMTVVLEDIGADVIKTGMLHNAEVIRTISNTLESLGDSSSLVIDPVMVAKGGHSLLQTSAIDALKIELIPKAHVLTPNIPEAEVLAGIEITSVDDMRRAGEYLLDMGPKSVLIKGGHLKDDTLTDILLTQSEEKLYSSPRLKTVHTHGTGCTLASAIAAGIAQGLEVQIATERARKYVFEAIRTAPGLGAGHGPLNHAHTISKMAK